MKIWHITKTIYGGSGQYALRLSQSLNDLGHQSTVFVAEGDTPLGVSPLLAEHTPVEQFVNRCFLSLLRRVSKGPYHSVFRMERWRNDVDEFPDVIHLHGLTGWIGFRRLRDLIPKAIPVFWTAHDFWMLSGGCVVYQSCDHYQTKCNKCPILKPVAANWSQHEWQYKANFLSDYQVIPIANGQWMANKIKQSPLFQYIKNKAVPIVAPIVDPIFFENPLLSPSAFDQTVYSRLREHLSISSERIVLGLSARALTDTYKGIPEFLQYFSLDENLAGRCTFILCGDGQIDVPDNLDCRFLGALTSTEALFEFYATCDVFISPSHMETFGMTLLEAQAVGVPIVTFRVGGTPEAVSHLTSGYLARHADYDDLLTGIRWALQGFSGKSKPNLSISDWVRQRFSSSVLGETQLDIYRQFTHSLCN